MITNPSELPDSVPYCVKFVIDILRRDCDMLQNPSWYLTGVVTTHNQLLVAAIEESRQDDAKTAATYLMAAATLLLTSI